MPVSSLIASLTWIEPMRRAQHAEHAALGAARDHARRRRLGVEAAVARARRRAERRREDRGLAVEAVDRAPDVGDLQEVRRVVDHVAGREVVGAVDDQVVALEDLACTLSLSRRSSCRTTLTYGLASAIDSLADCALGFPMSDWPWMIWRCRLDSSTSSNSAMPMRAARRPRRGRAARGCRGRRRRSRAPWRSSGASARSSRRRG